MDVLLAVLVVLAALVAIPAAALLVGNVVTRPIDFVLRGWVRENFIRYTFGNGPANTFVGYGLFGLLWLVLVLSFVRLVALTMVCL